MQAQVALALPLDVEPLLPLEAPLVEPPLVEPLRLELPLDVELLPLDVELLLDVEPLLPLDVEVPVDDELLPEPLLEAVPLVVAPVLPLLEPLEVVPLLELLAIVFVAMVVVPLEVPPPATQMFVATSQTAPGWQLPSAPQKYVPGSELARLQAPSADSNTGSHRLTMSGPYPRRRLRRGPPPPASRRPRSWPDRARRWSRWAWFRRRRCCRR